MACRVFLMYRAMLARKAAEILPSAHSYAKDSGASPISSLILHGQLRFLAVPGRRNVAGGMISAYSGMAAISDDTRIVMQTPRNLLRDLYLGPERSDIFPPSTWRYLNRPLRSAGAEGTVREDLIRQWFGSGVLGEAGSQAEQQRLALITGDGGAYQTGDFAARSQMLDLFKATMSSMSDDVEFMLRELTRRRLASDWP